MHWLLVSARHHPGHGGIGAYITHFCAAAREAGWRVDLITRPGRHHPPAACIREIRTPDDDPAFLRRIPALRRLERIRPYRYGLWSLAVAERLLRLDTRPDVIEFVDCQAEGYLALCSKHVRAALRGVPMIVHAHTPMFIEEAVNGCDERRFGRTIYHRWERQALRAADGIIVGSRLMAECLGMRATVVAPCLPRKHARPAQPAGIDRHNILLVGSAQPRKGVDVWVRSLNIILRRRPRACAALIGADTATAPGNMSMIQAVRELIHPKFRSRLQWWGSLTHEQTLRAIAAATMVVVPSRFESLSYVAVEALMHGRPVILTDRVGLAEWIEDPTTVPAIDVPALADAQLRIFDDLPTAEQAAARAREHLLQACPPRRHLDDKKTALERITSSRRHSGASFDHEDDAIDRMRRFLASVESTERGAPASMAPAPEYPAAERRSDLKESVAP
jgi:glycosyltransferase involved in cell wall biosynthesis